MPTICRFRGIKISINWRDHMPPHFHAFYGGAEVLVSIEELEVLEGSMPSKQLKMLLGWAPRELGACKKSAGVVLHRAAEIRRLYHGKHS